MCKSVPFFFVFLWYGGIAGTNKFIKIMTRNYELQAQRRARKIADIKEMYYCRLAEENKKPEDERMKLMDIYEEVAYHFYLSDTAVRAIIAGRR